VDVHRSSDRPCTRSRDARRAATRYRLDPHATPMRGREDVMHKLTDEQNRFGFHVHAFAAVMTMLLLVAINLW
jgi:hypothetical protein